jgi:hypothetical protein
VCEKSIQDSGKILNHSSLLDKHNVWKLVLFSVKAGMWTATITEVDVLQILMKFLKFPFYEIRVQWKGRKSEALCFFKTP